MSCPQRGTGSNRANARGFGRTIGPLVHMHEDDPRVARNAIGQALVACGRQ